MRFLQKNITSWLMLITLLFMCCSTGYSTETSLLFVGEELDVLTIASRRAERQGAAPAVAAVVTRKDFQRMGDLTLAHVLARQPGFHIAPVEWGSRLWLRGIADSVLFLYDSTPLFSNSSKYIYPLDQELSLSPVKRIEIIRGPGTVLWGPDAFAGIVNVVPLRGSDINGFEITGTGSGRGDGSFSINWGSSGSGWDGFISLNAGRSMYDKGYNLVSLSDDGYAPVPYPQRFGTGHLDDSHTFEAVADFYWQDWLHISGRWSENNRNYVYKSRDRSVVWAGERDTPYRFIRLELKKQVGSNGFRLNCYYDNHQYREQQVDLAPWHQDTHVMEAEFLYDRELWDSTALLTLGISYRYTDTDGAVVNRPYVPDFADEGNDFFLPGGIQTNFHWNLYSFFAQFRRSFSKVDCWAGIRVDNHSAYSTSVTESIGASWKFARDCQVKLLYGNAYRTPYGLQLLDSAHGSPENVRNISAELAWSPLAGISFTVVPFWNRIRNHIQEDPVVGLSQPGSADIFGVEFAFSWQPGPEFRIYANSTLLANDDSEQSYTVYKLEFDNGQWQRIPAGKYSTPFDTGPHQLVNCGMSYSFLPNIEFVLNASYNSSVKYVYANDPVTGDEKGGWVLDSTVTWKDFILPGLDAMISARNLLGRSYENPGIYGPVKARPFTLFFQARYGF